MARSKTLNPTRATKRELVRLQQLPAVEGQRPTSRGECADQPRPCPWVSCRYHLYLDVDHRGALKLNFPDREPWEIEETCALDVADQGGLILEEVGRHMNLTRERVRQVADQPSQRLALALQQWRAHAEEL